MVIAFMLSRFRGPFPAAAFLVVSSLLAITCTRVPLLAPSGSTITLTASATALPVNGTTQLLAQVIEASGTAPHSGTLVTFTTSLGAIQPSDAETDSAGRALVTFRAGNSNGTATITAISGGAGGTTTTGTTTTTSANVVKIAVGTAAVGRVSVNANPAQLSSTGGTAAIVASVYDINGNPLPNALVSFTTTAGSLGASTVNTDGNGSAVTSLRTVVTATVTATVGASGTTAPPATGTAPAATGQTSGSVIVNVSGAPALNITAPASASAGTPSTFTFAVTAPTGVVVRDVIVSWGDATPIQDLGAISGTVSVQHAYASQGTYQVTATLTDTAGDTVPVNTSVVVIATPLPTVNITLPTVPAIVTYPFTAILTIQVTPPAGVGIADVTVDFGNGRTTDLGGLTGSASVSSQYPGPNTYTVRVIVLDTLGRTTQGTATLVLP
jgi:Bacterial Ig-like domain (group 1)/PKD domain